MGEAPLREVLGGAALYLLCCLALLFLRLLPLNAGLAGWPGPDLALCLTFAWVLRRPERLPALVIALVFLVEDILLMRPIGLGAAIVLIATEAARLREVRWRDQPFMVEWLRVGLLLGAMLLGYRIVQVMFLLPVPALGQVILQFIATLAAYPLVVVAAQGLFGLRRVSPAEADLIRYR